MSEDLKNAIRKRCRKMEIPLVGVASVEQWKDPPFLPWMPEEFYPQSIYPEARSVIVIGLPVSLPVLETSPSIFYRELYNTVNALLDQYTYRLANFLNDSGQPLHLRPQRRIFRHKGAAEESSGVLLPPPCCLSGGPGHIRCEQHASHARVWTASSLRLRFHVSRAGAGSAPGRPALHQMHALREDVPGKCPGREGLSTGIDRQEDLRRTCR